MVIEWSKLTTNMNHEINAKKFRNVVSPNFIGIIHYLKQKLRTTKLFTPITPC